MSKSTMIDHRINKPAKKSGLQQAVVPGSSTAKGSKGPVCSPRGR